jgi:glucan biosynthesis protein C
MLLLIPYHGLVFLQHRGEEMPGLDFSVFWLHLWRMALFFAVSGFLAAMAVRLWGPSEQVVRRLKRIGIPLVIAMLTVLPAMKFVVFWFAQRQNPETDLPAVEYTFSNLLGWQPFHLWFLVYLLAFNFVAVLAWVLLRRLPDLTAIGEQTFRRLLDSAFLIPVLALISVVPLMAGGFFVVPSGVDASLVPQPTALGYYGLFFGFGWMLWCCRDRLDAVESRPWKRLAASLVTSVLAYLVWTGRLALPADIPIRPVVLITSAIALWSTLFAVWGLVAKFLSDARPWVRYLADASYWIYLVHPPILFLIERSIAGSGYSPALRFIIASALTTGFALLTYSWLVRYSRIGAVLHGPRTRPETGRPRAAAAEASG